jgi:uncharacterized protein (DUF849 family)
MRAMIARVSLRHTVSWDAQPVVITVAPTGAEVTRKDNPALPQTLAEIAADVVACAQAGAAVAHLHVREQDGAPSSRPGLFAETIALIRESSDGVTMVSTGGAVWMPMEERMGGLDAGPDMAGVETGSMNYLRRGVLAGSNAELVSDAADLVRTLGRHAATVEQARELLSVPVRACST